MLKKAGIVVAVAAAGLLALSPLAFAGDKGHDDHHNGGKDHHHTTVVEAGDAPQCTFDAAAVNNAEQLGEGGDALGLGGAVANLTGAQANTQTQAPIGSCNSIEDVLDVNVEDNFQDNSTTSSETATDIDDSFNTED